LLNTSFLHSTNKGKLEYKGHCNYYYRDLAWKIESASHCGLDVTRAIIFLGLVITVKY
jgi:hypothetical protein